MVIGWDVETHLIETGLLAPPLVCLSLAGGPDTRHAAAEFFDGLDAHFAPADDGWAAVVTKSDALSTFRWMRETADVLVAHNGVFDYTVMAITFPELLPALFEDYETGKMRCTRLREQLTAIAYNRFKWDDDMKFKPGERGFPLSYLVQRHFGVTLGGKARTDINGKVIGDADAWRLRYKELDGVAMSRWPRAAIEYAAMDSVWARKVFLSQSSPSYVAMGTVVTNAGDVVNELEQQRADIIMHIMSVRGVRLDPDSVATFTDDVTRYAGEAEGYAKQAGFLRVNRCKKGCEGTGLVGLPPNLKTCTWCNGEDDDVAQANGRYKFRGKKPFKRSQYKTRLQQWVQHAYAGVDVPRTPPSTKYPQGQVRTKGDDLLGSGVPALVEYAERKVYEKYLTTYVPILQKAQHTALTSRPNVLVRSGRTSWSKPNLQNPPQKGGFRECFVPRPGQVFASIDYSSLEMATLAQVCIHFFGYSKLGDVINGGLDPHAWFAALMTGTDYEVFNEYRAGKQGPEKKEWADTKRQNAKIANFGLPGGLGVNTLITYAKGFGVDLTPNEADDLVWAWKDAFPEVREYFKMLSNASQHGDFTIKQVTSNRIRGGCHYTSGCNSYFQGLAADGAKAAMWEIGKACYLKGYNDKLYGCHMWAFIHDEFLFEGPADWAHVWATEAERIMVEQMKRYVPDVTIAAPPALMSRWLKKADTKYDEDGKLVLWG